MPRFQDIVTILVDYVNPFSDPRAQIQERATARGLRYALYEPPDYDAHKSYALLVHLHGAGEPYAWMTRELKWTAEQLEQLGVNNLIVVAPHDPTQWSMWVNGNDIDAATQVLDDLVPEIRRQYPNVERQYLQGFSMGGFGAATHGHLFDKTVLWDGALHTWESLQAARKSVCEKQFGNDRSKFEAAFPYSASNTKMFPKQVLMFSGAMPETKRFGEKYQAFLEEQQVFHQHVVTDLPHSYKQFIHTEAHFQKVVAFLSEA